MPVVLTVVGEPIPWQRARRNGKRYFNAEKVSEFQERVRAAWMVGGRLSFDPAEPVALAATFVLGRPKSHFTKRGALTSSAPLFPRCDVDNLVKGVLDALNDCLYNDDSQVVRVDATKRYVSDGEGPSTELIAVLA